MPVHLGEKGHPGLGPGDVVIVTGGARGATSFIAEALAPLGVRLVLLGRTESLGVSLEGDEAADQPEIREILESRGLGDAYAQVREIPAAFARELALAPPDACDTLLVRALPATRTARLTIEPPRVSPGRRPVELAGGGLPLIDVVTDLDEVRGISAPSGRSTTTAISG